MRQITHREMRNNSADVLRAVAAGETLQVTNNGSIAAIISPPCSSALAQLIADGQARAAKRPLSDLNTITRLKVSISTEALLDDVRGRW